MPKPALKNLQHTPDWQQQLAQAITDPAELLGLLQIEPQQFPRFSEACQHFSLKVPLSYIAKMTTGDINDPLLKQVMATALELDLATGYHADPTGDLDAMPIPGLLHKYQGRALLITTGACAIHCRYCFRRHFPYADNHSSHNHWHQAIHYLEQHTNISEIILSGGDPLVLSDHKLSKLIHQLSNIPHIRRLRIHSRLPIVLPERITHELCQTLTQNRLRTSLVIHANHAREIASAETQALTRLNEAGITLLNQSVLLKDINDSYQTLVDLSERLYEAQVLPYYLHVLDPVQGAAHFDVEENHAIKLIEQMRTVLPGYLVPRLVREIPGKNSKIPVNEL